MKSTFNTLIVCVISLATTMCFSQTLTQSDDLIEYAVIENFETTPQAYQGNNGFSFETFPTEINSKYADYGIGFFRDKFLSFSAKKIGALAKFDPKTKEPYTKLYCSDMTSEYDLKRPLLFSSLLNRNENLGTLTFANDGNTLYFTKSKDEDTQSFDLYRAEMSIKRPGAWTNITKLDFNGEDFSIENPHVSRNGKLLYFSSNGPEAIGGYDIFQVRLKDDKPQGSPSRIDGSVNTVLDEKFPQTSLDGKYLYFASTGHNSNGGYDIFRSRKTRMGYVSVRSLGNTINTPKDEVAFIQATPTVGYLTSNRAGGKGSFDIYKIKESIINVRIAGKIIDNETQIPLANASVVLLDENGEEVANMRSGDDGSYDFVVDPFLDYTVLSYKSKFERNSISVNTASEMDKVLENNIALMAEAAPIVVIEEKTFIQIDNIQFDYDSAIIKDISTITLNSVVTTLLTNPEIQIAIKAHTDTQGSATYNQKLSNKRAAAAMEYLINKGISLDRMSSEGFGESQPLIDCDQCTPEQNKQNRRVEFVVLDKK